jgi:SAM-dependent methyltransferase
MIALVDLLKMRCVRDIKNLDDPSIYLLHERIIRDKLFLKRLYEDFYRHFKNFLPLDIAARNIVELGSGGGFIKDVIPYVLTSDISNAAAADISFSATQMPFKDNSIDAFLLLNVFHHAQEPLDWLNEMSRCLRSKGKIIMIEPSNTPWRRFIDKNFHHEKFDISAEWEIEGSGPLTAANGALPWIIFSRDRVLFERRLPSLKIRSIELHTNFRYIVSGGLTYRQLLPSFMYSIIKALEGLASPLNKYLGYFQTIELEKN